MVAVILLFYLVNSCALAATPEAGRMEIRYEEFYDTSSSYDCESTQAFVKVGVPSDEGRELQLCTPPSVRTPLPSLNKATNCWQRCSQGDIASEEARSWFFTSTDDAGNPNNVMAEVVNNFTDILEIWWPTSSVRLAASAKPAEGEDQVPQVCPMIERPLPDAIPDLRLDDHHLKLYVTMRPTSSSAPSESTVCHRDGYGRPVVAHININAAYAARLTRADDRRGAVAELRHQLLHVLAFTWNSMYQFRRLTRQPWARVLSDSIGEVRGAPALFLVTPAARYQVRAHYNLNASYGDEQLPVPGLEVTGIDALTSSSTPAQVRLPPFNEVHISPQVARSDIMSPAYNGYSVLSKFTLAVLSDSGWYKPNMDLAEEMEWGLGQPPSFLTAPPNDTGTPLDVPAYSCMPNSQSKRTVLSCSYDSAFKGFCVEGDGTSSTNSLSSYVAPFQDFGSCLTGAADGPQGVWFKGSNLLPEEIGDSSRCFRVRDPSKVKASTSNEDVKVWPVCLKATCSNTAISFEVDGVEYDCPFGGTVDLNATQGNVTMQLEVECPEKAVACPGELEEPPCPNSCTGGINMGSGLCSATEGAADYTCNCTEPWAGEDCSSLSCTSPQECGEKQGNTGGCEEGQCMCDEDHTGMQCSLPVPECDTDCAMLGEGYHCRGNQCERLCSSQGYTCVNTSSQDFKKAFYDRRVNCKDVFENADATTLCVPAGDLNTVAAGMEAMVENEMFALEPASDSRQARSKPCNDIIKKIACFTVFQECQANSEVKLPLCKRLCDVYNFECGMERTCTASPFRDTRDSDNCSGSADPGDYLAYRYILYIVFAVVAVLIGVLLIWASRIWISGSRLPLCLAYLPLRRNRANGADNVSLGGTAASLEASMGAHTTADVIATASIRAQLVSFFLGTSVQPPSVSNGASPGPMSHTRSLTHHSPLSLSMHGSDMSRVQSSSAPVPGSNGAFTAGLGVLTPKSSSGYSQAKRDLALGATDSLHSQGPRQPSSAKGRPMPSAFDEAGPVPAGLEQKWMGNLLSTADNKYAPSHLRELSSTPSGSTFQTSGSRLQGILSGPAISGAYMPTVLHDSHSRQMRPLYGKLSGATIHEGVISRRDSALDMENVAGALIQRGNRTGSLVSQPGSSGLSRGRLPGVKILKRLKTNNSSRTHATSDNGDNMTQGVSSSLRSSQIVPSASQTALAQQTNGAAHATRASDPRSATSAAMGSLSDRHASRTPSRSDVHMSTTFDTTDGALNTIPATLEPTFQPAPVSRDASRRNAGDASSSGDPFLDSGSPTELREAAFRRPLGLSPIDAGTSSLTLPKVSSTTFVSTPQHMPQHMPAAYTSPFGKSGAPDGGTIDSLAASGAPGEATLRLDALQDLPRSASAKARLLGHTGSLGDIAVHQGDRARSTEPFGTDVLRDTPRPGTAEPAEPDSARPFGRREFDADESGAGPRNGSQGASSVEAGTPVDQAGPASAHASGTPGQEQSFSEAFRLAKRNGQQGACISEGGYLDRIRRSVELGVRENGWRHWSEAHRSAPGHELGANLGWRGTGNHSVVEGNGPGGFFGQEDDSVASDSLASSRNSTRSDDESDPFLDDD